MARRLITDQQIDKFISKVIIEANHHSPQVAKIIVPLSDEVRNRLDLAKDRVEVYERLGKMARTCWVLLNGKRYVFTYNYDDSKIDLRDKSTQGRLRFQFDNNTSLSTICREVKKL